LSGGIVYKAVMPYSFLSGHGPDKLSSPRARKAAKDTLIRRPGERRDPATCASPKTLAPGVRRVDGALRGLAQ